MNGSKLPRDLTVALSDIEHGYNVIATAQVSWGPAEQAALNGGPLHLAFWQDSLVILTPSGSGSNANLQFFVRNVGYNVRAEVYRQADGSWDVGQPGKKSPEDYRASVDRSDWRTVSEMQASDAARRDITAILRAVGRHIAAERPDLFLDAAVTETRKKADGAQATVANLRRELAEAQLAAQAAEDAAQAAKLARIQAQS